MALARWQATIVDENGNIKPGASMDVFDEATGARPTLKPNRDGSGSLGNPFVADSEAFAAFHVIGGAYRIVATLGDFSREWRYVPIGTAAEVDIDELSGDVIMTGDRYEIGNWDSDRPASGEELLSWLMTTNVTFPISFTGSRAKARVASTGAAVYSVQKNDVEIGTVTFTASVTGVFALASETSFAAGDRFSVVAPNPRDSTLSGVVMTIVASR